MPCHPSSACWRSNPAPCAGTTHVHTCHPSCRHFISHNQQQHALGQAPTLQERGAQLTQSPSGAAQGGYEQPPCPCHPHSAVMHGTELFASPALALQNCSKAKRTLAFHTPEHGGLGPTLPHRAGLRSCVSACTQLCSSRLCVEPCAPCLGSLPPTQLQRLACSVTWVYPPILLLPTEKGARTEPKTIPWGCAGPRFTACSLLEMQLLRMWQVWSSQARLNTEQGNAEKCRQERPNIAGEGETSRDAHSSWEGETSTS